MASTTGGKAPPPKRMRVLGARKILKIIDRDRLSVASFAARAGLGRVTLTRILNGQRWKNISINFIRKVRAAAPGELDFEDFYDVTAEPAADDEGDDEPPLQAAAVPTDAGWCDDAPANLMRSTMTLTI